MAKCEHEHQPHPDCPWCSRQAGGGVKADGSGAEQQPRNGDLRFEGMGADSKMFAFLQPWNHAEGSWYEVRLPGSAEDLLVGLSATEETSVVDDVPAGNIKPYTKTTVHPDIGNLFRPPDPEVEASVNRVLAQHRELGRFPTCSSCGYTGYMVTKLMGDAATAYMCPKEGCGHLTPIVNRSQTGGHAGPPMGWVQERRGTWTNLDEDGVAAGEALGIRLTPNEWKLGLFAESGEDLQQCQPIGCDNGIHLPGCKFAAIDELTTGEEGEPCG